MKSCMTIIALMIIVLPHVWAGNEAMPSMPILKPQKTFLVKDGEELESQRGFGDEEPMTRMMNLMMVEGSGMEGMDMNSMKMAENKGDTHSMAGMDNGNSESSKSTTEKPTYEIEVTSKTDAVKVGANVIDFSVSETQKPSKGLKIKSQVYMTSMDMGTEEPKVKEVSPGKYQVKAIFAMKGPWAIKFIFSNKQEQILNFEVNSK